MSKKKKAQNSPVVEQKAANKQTIQSRRSMPTSRRTTITLMVIMVLMAGVFIWKWVEVIRDGYFDAFVVRGENTADAVASMKGLTPTAEESAILLTYQQEWDLYTASRLRDEVNITGDDGTQLHAYYFDEGSDLTVVVVHQFDGDGTEDFLAGSWLYETYGCNFLLIDQRTHGESEGDYFGYGFLEQYDLACWLDWARTELHTESFILWGQGSGANTILFAAAGGLLSDDVLCIVADSPFASLHELASTNIWEFFGVPSFLFLDVIEYKLASSDAGYTVEDVELASALAADGTYAPVIILESAGDEYILNEWTESVYDAITGEKTLISGGGTHGTVYAYCAEQIQSAIAEFVD